MPALLALVLAVLLAFGSIAELRAQQASQPAVAPAIEAYDQGDYERAAKLLEEVIATAPSKAERAEAQTLLAGMIEKDLVPGRSPSEALNLYEKAAVSGDPVAQMNLGDHYLKGRFLPKEEAKAYAWLKLAGEGGQEWAATEAQKLWRAFSAGNRLQGTLELERLRKRLN